MAEPTNLYPDDAPVGMPRADQLAFHANITRIEPYVLGPDSLPQKGVPQGELHHRRWTESKIYLGTERDYWVYVPAQYDPVIPAHLIVFQDGGLYLGPDANVPMVLDNLIHKGEIPVTIGVFLMPGDKGPGLPIYGGDDNRSLEYDSLTDDYARFLLEEILPTIEAQYTITNDPAGRAICGISSGGICAFTVAWHRPDVFGNVVTHCGSYTNIRGGHQYPFIIRRSPPKPLRVFLQSGTHDLNVVFGDWFLANQVMASALAYKGYDHQLVLGEGGHTLKHGGSIFPDTMRWLWGTSRAD